MITTADGANPYDRQFEENEVQWSAFVRYRDLPNPRPALDVFARDTLYSVSRLKEWSRNLNWTARLLAWDQRVDSIRQKTVLTGVEEMTKRHIELSGIALEAVRKALAAISKDLDSPTVRLRPNEIARLAEVFIKVERLARGEATERVDAGGEVDYSNLSDADLQALADISRRMR